MTIRIDHIGVPAHSRAGAARLVARILDLDPEIPDDGRFAQVQVGSAFTIDFFDLTHIQPMHLAFVADDEAFDRVLGKLESLGIAFGSQPNDPTNGRTDHPLVQRGVYFRVPDGHLFEVMATSLKA